MKVFRIIGFVIALGSILFTFYLLFNILLFGVIKLEEPNTSLLIVEIIITIIGIPSLFILLGDIIKNATL